MTVDDREPLQLQDELAELGSEVEVRRLTKGDFKGTTTIGETKRGFQYKIEDSHGADVTNIYEQFLKLVNIILGKED